MTRIDFYILPSDSLMVRIEFACKLAAKAARLNHNILIYCDNESDCQLVASTINNNESFRFMPFCLLNNNNDISNENSVLPPIQIGFNNPTVAHHDILINLSVTRASFFAQFDRLSEIVIQEESILNVTRDSYRYYQSRNYPLHRHDMR